MPKSADFILDPKRLPVVFVEPYGPGFAALVKGLGEVPQLQVVECVSAMDAFSVIRNTRCCLVVAHVGAQAALTQCLVLLRTLAPMTAEGAVRVLVTSVLDGAETLAKLTQAGATEILPVPVAVKGLLFKIERQLKMLPFEGAPAGGGAGGSQAVRDAAPGVRLGAPAVVPGYDDLFVLSGGGAGRVAGRWEIKLKGPAPGWGRWIPVTGTGRWRWQNEGDAVERESEGWVWDGAKPEPRDGYWLLTSEEPRLAYVAGSETLGHKLKLNARGSLVVSADTPNALAAALAATLGQPRPGRRPAAVRASRPERQGMQLIRLSSRDDETAPSSLAVRVSGAEPSAAASPRAPDGRIEPSISSIGLAFIVSELMCRHDLGLNDLASQYCAYVSRSFAGLRTELWVPSRSGEWACAGTSDGSEGKAASLAGLDSGRALLDGLPAAIVAVKTSGAERLGALVIFGEGAETLPGKAAAAAARVATGILRGFHAAV